VEEVFDLVTKMMSTHGLTNDCEWIGANHIDGYIFQSLDHEALKGWGVTSFGIRMRILEMKMKSSRISGTSMRSAMTVHSLPPLINTPPPKDLRLTMTSLV
jgi:hypothetical protein